MTDEVDEGWEYEGDYEGDYDEVDDGLDIIGQPRWSNGLPTVAAPGFTHREVFVASFADVLSTGQALRSAGRAEWVSSLAQRLQDMGCPQQVSDGFRESMVRAGQYLVLEAAVAIAALIVLFNESGERERLMSFNRAIENVTSFTIEQDNARQTYALHITGELPFATGGVVGRPENNVSLNNAWEVNRSALGLEEIPPEPPKPHVEAPRRLRVRKRK